MTDRTIDTAKDLFLAVSKGLKELEAIDEELGALREKVEDQLDADVDVDMLEEEYDRKLRDLLSTRFNTAMDVVELIEKHDMRKFVRVLKDDLLEQVKLEKELEEKSFVDMMKELQDVEEFS